MLHISVDTLSIWKDEAEVSGDSITSMLITQLLETYRQLDSERAQKKTIVKASSTMSRELIDKDRQIAVKNETIENLIAAAMTQDQTVKNAIDAFRKIFELSAYGNIAFKSEPLLRLWIESEKLIGSTSSEEVDRNTVSVMSIHSELNDNQQLIDARDNIIMFTDYIEKTKIIEPDPDADLSSEIDNSIENKA